MAKKKLEPKTNSLANMPFTAFLPERLSCRVHAWNEKVRIEISMGMPYKMCFMLDLSEPQAQQLATQINISLEDLGIRPAPKRKAKP